MAEKTKSPRNLAIMVTGFEQDVVDLLGFAEECYALGSWRMIRPGWPDLDLALADSQNQQIQTPESADQIGLGTVRNPTGSVVAAFGFVAELGPPVVATFALYFLPASEFAHSSAADLLAENIAQSLLVGLQISRLDY